MHGKSDPAVRSGGARVATKEQLRVAQATQEGQDEDRSRVQKMIKEIIETTRCSQSQAEIALHDANNNVELAVNNILESSELEAWSHYKRKGPKTKEEEREEQIKKGGNRPARRTNQGQRDSKGPRNTENGNESRENRQPREKEDGGVRSGRAQPSRTRREPTGKRDNKKNAETKDESDDYWKNGPLVFNRRDNIDEKEQQPIGEPIKPQPTAAGPLSFADVVRKSAQKPQPPVQPPSDSQFKLQVSNDARQTSPSPHSLKNDVLGADDNAVYNQALPENSKSPRQPIHHLDEESSSNLLHEDAVTFGTQPSPQKLQQSLTDQLKNDLGLGQHSNTMGFAKSPPKKYQEPMHQPNKAPAVKAGVVEFLSGDIPAASSGDWQFGFEAAPVPQSNIVEDHQFRRDNAKMNESSRNEMGLSSSNINEPSQSRGNASTVFNQYVQQQAQQSNQPPHLPYGHQQSFNRNRNGLNSLPFSNNYSDNFNSDLRSSTYGAPSSPPKSQNLASQQQQLQSQQHHHIFPPNQLPYANYPYITNMYSPVAAPGIRDDLTTLLPFQYNMNQFGLDALTMMPQMTNVTSAGPLQTNHQSQHHQTHPQQQSVQQGLQHNQNSHSQTQPQNHQRNEHYNDIKFLNNPMNIPPTQQNNGANGHNSQQNSNLGNNQQQRQQMLDNNSQGSVTGVAPPPGFTPNNIAAAPFMPQRNMNSINSMFPPSFQVPFAQQFPYILPSAQHKSK